MRNAIVGKSFQFSVKIVEQYKRLSNERREYVMSRQLLRCGTSIGANITESQQAQSRADFISKLSIALKEACETDYWLRLLNETDYITDEVFRALIGECRELEKLLTAIIRSSKQ